VYPVCYIILIYACVCWKKQNEIRKRLQRTGRHAATWDGKTEKNISLLSTLYNILRLYTITRPPLLLQLYTHTHTHLYIFMCARRSFELTVSYYRYDNDDEPVIKRLSIYILYMYRPIAGDMSCTTPEELNILLYTIVYRCIIILYE